MKDLYVVNCCRTAIGSFGGSLKNTPAAEMGAVVVKEALKRANVAPENVDELMFGCILTAAQGQNVARQVSIKAGIPYSVPAYTVGMVCGSGMKSVIEGARSILAGDSDVVVCGGTENMSAAPYALPSARWGARMFNNTMIDLSKRSIIMTIRGGQYQVAVNGQVTETGRFQIQGNMLIGQNNQGQFTSLFQLDQTGNVLIIANQGGATGYMRKQ